VVCRNGHEGALRRRFGVGAVTTPYLVTGRLICSRTPSPPTHAGRRPAPVCLVIERRTRRSTSSADLFLRRLIAGSRSRKFGLLSGRLVRPYKGKTLGWRPPATNRLSGACAPGCAGSESGRQPKPAVSSRKRGRQRPMTVGGNRAGQHEPQRDRPSLCDPARVRAPSDAGEGGAASWTGPEAGRTAVRSLRVTWAIGLGVAAAWEGEQLSAARGPAGICLGVPKLFGQKSPATIAISRSRAVFFIFGRPPRDIKPFSLRLSRCTIASPPRATTWTPPKPVRFALKRSPPPRFGAPYAGPICPPSLYQSTRDSRHQPVQRRPRRPFLQPDRRRHRRARNGYRRRSSLLPAAL
jgi:hypothetical protein